MQFVRCEHCRLFHEADVSVCPATGLEVRPARTDTKARARVLERAVRPPPSPPVAGVMRPSPAARARLGVGAVLEGRYALDDEGGRLGPAVVFHGHHVRQGQRVSVRVFHRALGDEETLDRLRSAARAASQLNHANIVRLLDVGATQDGSIYVVTEPLEGETLADAIRAGGPQSADDLFTLAREVLAGLAHAETRGVTHGVLRTDQILLARADGGARAQILDHAIAPVLADQGEGTLTHTGASITAPYYMAPELLSGAAVPNHACDLWSAAVVFYEVATGTLPFTALNVPGLIRQILEEPATPPSRYRRDFPQAFDAVLLTALEKRAEKRFPTASAMSEAFLDAQVEVTRASAPRSGNFALPLEDAELGGASPRPPRRS